MDRLRQRADFLAVANGARANSAAFVVQSRRRDDDGPIRIGFTVTKKNGTVIVAAAALHHEGSAVRPRAIGNGEKVRPLPQPIHE